MDLSNGYEKIASEFISARNKTLGISFFQEWSESLNTASKILDLGCGDGIPVTKAITESGHSVFAIDASKSMMEAFKSNFPNILSKCEAVEHSDFFEQEYDGVIAIGVVFLLNEQTQLDLIRKVEDVLRPGGQFLFSAPIQTGRWRDILTERESISLGEKQYVQALSSAGLHFMRTALDEGNNNYYIAEKPK